MNTNFLLVPKIFAIFQTERVNKYLIFGHEIQVNVEGNQNINVS